ncbi:MAG: hypothetical protein DSZ06_03280 [Sulfurospirillum sp.]|nr:MAG: hypothetical protein DSZ06_03280 [Sulfurospirillum sp.]
MPISPIDAINYANQNTNVAATKKGEYDIRVEKQSFIAVQESLKKDINIEDVNEISEDKPIDEEREHERNEAEEQSGEKEVEIKLKLKKSTIKEKQEDTDTTFHILNIKV